jgi:hypothetical protein
MFTEAGMSYGKFSALSKIVSRLRKALWGGYFVGTDLSLRRQVLYLRHEGRISRGGTGLGESDITQPLAYTPGSDEVKLQDKSIRRSDYLAATGTTEPD